MDILNWIYLKASRLIKSKANDIDTDILAIGANVGPAQRGDSYLTYGMTLGDFKNDVINGNMVYEPGTFSPLAFTTDPMPYYGTGRVNFPGIPKNLIYRLVGFVSVPGFANTYSIKIGELATTSPAAPLQEINVIANSSSIQEDGITGIGRAVSVLAPGAITRNFATSAPVILTSAYIRADNSINPLVQEVFVELAGPASFSCNVTLDILVGIPEGYTFTWKR
jgi:hypothetical protein